MKGIPKRTCYTAFPNKSGPGISREGDERTLTTMTVTTYHDNRHDAGALSRLGEYLISIALRLRISPGCKPTSEYSVQSIPWMMAVIAAACGPFIHHVTTYIQWLPGRRVNKRTYQIYGVVLRRMMLRWDAHCKPTLECLINPQSINAATTSVK